MSTRDIDQHPLGDGSAPMSRRNLLRAGGAVSASAVAASLLAACGDKTGGSATARSHPGSGAFPSHPKYKFTLIVGEETNSYFVATQYGAADACKILNCTYTWTGSSNDVVSDMVTAFNSAVAARVDGIAVQPIDSNAFKAPAESALNAGIPAMAINGPVPPNNDLLAYVGIDTTALGVAAGKEILKYVHKGDLVVGFMSNPGEATEQARIDGTASVLKPAGIDFITAGSAPLETQAISAVEAWYLGHKDVKFMYCVDTSSGEGIAAALKKYNLRGKVLGGGSGVTTGQIQAVQNGEMAFTVDSQPYLQGFLTIVGLFLYQVSGGLVEPVDTNTGIKFVNKDNVAPYRELTRYEGTSTESKLVNAPAKISL